MIIIKSKSLLLVAAIILVELALSIVGFIILPETIAIQVTASGEAGNMMPKIVGLALPLLLNIAFAVMYYLKRNKSYLFISIVTIAVSVFIIGFNI